MLCHCCHVGGQKQYLLWEIRSFFMQKVFHCFSPPTWLPWKPSVYSICQSLSYMYFYCIHAPVCSLFIYINTVEPSWATTSRKQPPLLNDHLTKISIGSFFSQIALSETSCKWPPKPPIKGGHLWEVALNCTWLRCFLRIPWVCTYQQTCTCTCSML